MFMENVYEMTRNMTISLETCGDHLTREHWYMKIVC